MFRELLLEAALQDERSRLDLRSWKFMSLPANDFAPSLRPAARDFKLEADLFDAPPATGNFQVPRDSRHFEGVPFSNHVKAPPSGAARRASLAAPVRGSAAPDLRVTPRPDRAPEVTPRITLTGAPALELEVVAKPQQTAGRAQPRVHKIARPIRPYSAAKPARKRSVVGAIVGWIAAACALAALIYVASAVFKRPDSRKLSPKTPASTPGSPSSDAR